MNLLHRRRLFGFLAVGLVCLTALDHGVYAQDRTPPAPGAQSSLTGYWLGTLSVRARELRLLLHIQPGTPLTATLTSIDQDNKPRDARIAVTDRTVVVEVGTSMRLTATLREDRRALEGTLDQGGASLPIVLQRVAGPPELRRPQHPVAPFPYVVEDVVVPGPVTLAGTLTKPRGSGRFPAVLLVSGSGPQDRDHTFFGHKPFLVLADHLTRRGIAVLRVDDRGAGASAGSRATATIEDYAADAAAGIKYLASRSDIDPRRVGLIGHSEGGVVAPLVARDNPAVAFLVLLAAPAMDGASIAMLQMERMARAAGASDEQLRMQQALNTALMRVLRDARDEAETRQGIRAVLKAELSKRGQGSDEVVAAAEAQLEPQIRRWLSPWFRHFLSHDPQASLRAIRVPTLALYGTLDVQVPAAENAPLMRVALAGSSQKTSVQELSGLNHLFQTAHTGALTEYGRIEETFSPAALDAISRWLSER